MDYEPVAVLVGILCYLAAGGAILLYGTMRQREVFEEAVIVFILAGWPMILAISAVVWGYRIVRTRLKERRERRERPVIPVVTNLRGIDMRQVHSLPDPNDYLKR